MAEHRLKRLQRLTTAGSIRQCFPYQIFVRGLLAFLVSQKRRDYALVREKPILAQAERKRTPTPPVSSASMKARPPVSKACFSKASVEVLAGFPFSNRATVFEPT